MYKYFVSYHYTNGTGFGFGHCQGDLDYKIDGIEAIRRLAKSIEEENNLENVVILNFKSFD